MGPLYVPLVSGNMAAANAAITWGVTGPVTAGVGACAAGTIAVAEGYHTLRRGDGLLGQDVADGFLQRSAKIPESVALQIALGLVLNVFACGGLQTREGVIQTLNAGYPARQ